MQSSEQVTFICEMDLFEGKFECFEGSLRPRSYLRIMAGTIALRRDRQTGVVSPSVMVKTVMVQSTGERVACSHDPQSALHHVNEFNDNLTCRVIGRKEWRSVCYYIMHEVCTVVCQCLASFNLKLSPSFTGKSRPW